MKLHALVADLDTARVAVDGGATVVQWRLKDVPTLEVVERGRATRSLCARHGVPFVARGAGTGLSGGALPVADGVVISLARLKRVLEVDPVDRHDVPATHGAGCTHSASLAAYLARGCSLEDAARRAARAASDAVQHGLVEIGAGEGPVDVLDVRTVA